MCALSRRHIKCITRRRRRRCYSCRFVFLSLVVVCFCFVNVGVSLPTTDPVNTKCENGVLIILEIEL